MVGELADVVAGDVVAGAVVAGALDAPVVAVVDADGEFAATTLICFGRDLACFFVSANPTQFVPGNVPVQMNVAVGVVHVPDVASAGAIKLPLRLAQTSLSVATLTFCLHTWESDSPWVVSFNPVRARTVSVGTAAPDRYLIAPHWLCPFFCVVQETTPPLTSQAPPTLPFEFVTSLYVPLPLAQDAFRPLTSVTGSAWAAVATHTTPNEPTARTARARTPQRLDVPIPPLPFTTGST